MQQSPHRATWPLTPHPTPTGPSLAQLLTFRPSQEQLSRLQVESMEPQPPLLGLDAWLGPFDLHLVGFPSAEAAAECVEGCVHQLAAK